MSNFLRIITSSSGKLIFTVVTPALLVLISVADLIVPNNKIRASGIAQDRVYQVKEGAQLSKVIKIEDIYNINSPEFPKRFQVKVKNVSSKPIYYMFIHVRLPETEPLRLKGYISFNLNFGHPKIGSAGSRLEDLTESEREEAILKRLEPGESRLLEADDLVTEHVRSEIETVSKIDNLVTKKVVLSIQIIGFGDGTGYVIGVPYPNTNNRRKISIESPKEPKPSNLNAFNLNRCTAKLLPRGFLFSPKPMAFFLNSISFFLPESASFFYLNQPFFHDTNPHALISTYNPLLAV